ncbi:transducin/WD40 repeat-like superfamily protein [Actinidia rufa]|uniref:Transducin/WD40 repeat-like superfamily protein n=1 Tax=Actinidia rufa TaxID=165716 RepID=A0A7J0GNY7_9ERIC|nr:transducin/WD40 repeat-like superfamily protein [Actinidia rufa]
MRPWKGANLHVVLDKGVPIKSLNEIKCVLVSALASHGQISDALNIYEEIKQAECNVEPKAIICLIEHLHSEGELGRLLQLLAEVNDPEYWIDGCCRVILYCVAHKHLSSTVDLLKQLKDKFCDDEVATEVLFDEVFCKIAETEPSDLQFGLDLLQAIKEELQVRPSRRSLDFLLSACVSAKDLNGSLLIWKEYHASGLPYNGLTFLRMYQALLASGDLKAATKMLNKIPKDDPHVRCVINACSTGVRAGGGVSGAVEEEGLQSHQQAPRRQASPLRRGFQLHRLSLLQRLRHFATVGGNRVTVYQCLDGGVIAVLQSYIDEDKDESFYTVSWACNTDGTPLLVTGGINGIIRVMDAGNEKIYKSFVGHGDSVNEIRTQALKPSLVVSASKDESVRLWNVHTGICILIFAGAGGHRNEVLSVDFHPSDIYRIASCGMDNTVKIWSMKEFWTYVEKIIHMDRSSFKISHKICSIPCIYSFNSFKLFDFIAHLQSVDNEIVLWEPKMKEQSPGEGSVDILQKYPVPECDIWFIKFSCDFHYNAAAIGNREGKIFVWELQSSPPVLIAKLSHVQSKSPIRQTAMSFDGSTILSCCEDGTIWRWDTVATS